MVERNYFRMLSDEEVSQYKFEFCKNCPFYECELIEEYEMFSKNHHYPMEHEGYEELRDANTGNLIGYYSSEDVDFDAQTRKKLNEWTAVVDNFGRKISLSYNKREFENGCIMGCCHVYQVECGRKTVTEGIGEDYKIELDYNKQIKEESENRWEPLQPVFISAQTGQGKNYFIEKTLIPYVRELNLKHQTSLKVLILSNRRALKAQIKKRLDGNYDSNKEDEIYFYNEYADVMTYQSLLFYEEKLKKKQQYAKSRYIYVVCDEAHFFTSDAMFNPHTQKILEKIADIFKDVIRVYMSATPYECLKYINKYDNRVLFYHFKRNYSYLDIKTYSEMDELYEIIAESIGHKEKWLIFIDDKNKCQTVKKQLEKSIQDKKSKNKNEKLKDENTLEKENDKSKEKVERVYVINADSKDDSVFQEIVKNERLNKDTYVLISTSVLDNGVNLTGIKNIVVSDMAKTKCLQMVGRARVEGKDDRKNLYIKRFSDEEIEKRKTDLMKQQDAYGKYKEAYKDEQPKKCCDTYSFFEKYYNGNKEDWKNAKRWFGRTVETELYFNKIAESLVDGLIPYHQSIYDEMIDEKAKEDNAQDISHMGQKYLEYQLSWFGKKYCEDDDITFADKEKAKKEFIDFLEEYAEKGTEIVSEKEINQFSKKFSKLFDAAFYKSDKNSLNYKALKMNRLLEKENIKYRIKGKAQVGPWTVVRDDK